MCAKWLLGRPVRRIFCRPPLTGSRIKLRVHAIRLYIYVYYICNFTYMWFIYSYTIFKLMYELCESLMFFILLKKYIYWLLVNGYKSVLWVLLNSLTTRCHFKTQILKFDSTNDADERTSNLITREGPYTCLWQDVILTLIIEWLILIAPSFCSCNFPYLLFCM